MTFDMEEYKKRRAELSEEYEKALVMFEEDLKKTALKEPTIRRHLQNVDVFLNDFLLDCDEDNDVAGGLSYINEFLGYFFIRKCMWSTPANIKTTAASLKKFYKSMLDHGVITAIDYVEMEEEIKINMPMWQADCEMYNDPDGPNPFFMGW